MARRFAEGFGSSDWAYLAGLWHDLGKYHPEFQTYLRQDPEANLENQKTKQGKGRVNHSSAGALYAIERFGVKGRILAWLIAGHHTGLLDWYGGGDSGGKTPLSARLQEQNEKVRVAPILSAAQTDAKDILDASEPASSLPKGADKGFGRSLWIRMLFSCLVDADFLDTESYMDGEKSDSRQQAYPSIAELKASLDAFLETKTKDAEKNDINGRRSDILAQCRAKADEEPGLFSLTVPTGGGKTLSSMAFALDHALKHGKQRVIYVIPFTSIIEQNAKVFKEVFGEENVIEHHSNFDHGEGESVRTRLACENWDAPIIVTTNVQFLESLFAARTSRVRKLHNIVNSVVIFDETQLLPVEFLYPILRSIEQLKTVYGATLVFCTATQPALTSENNPALKSYGLQNVREIVADPAMLAEKLERVTIDLPTDWHTHQDWEDIAGEIQKHNRILCIVNRRDDARDLYRILREKQGKDGLYHLSALMYPAHRSMVIDEIKARLIACDSPVRVVSTQLIEAGVDIDFPVVYRAMAGLDSIAQAAGRCNREGKLGHKGGRVKVFVPTTQPPCGILRKAAETSRECIELARKNGGGILTPDAFSLFFKKLYYNASALDAKGILDELKDQGQLEFQILTAANRFKLIEDAGSAPVIVWREEDDAMVSKWLAPLRQGKLDRWSLRKLQRFTVTIPKPWHTRLLADKDVEEILPGVFIQRYLQLYNHELGFVGSDDSYQEQPGFIT